MGKHYSQLSMDERNEIHRCSNEGLSLRAIARRLNRPASAVSREVARNTVGKSYDAARAEQTKWRGRYVEFNLLYDRGTTFGRTLGEATATRSFPD